MSGAKDISNILKYEYRYSLNNNEYEWIEYIGNSDAFYEIYDAQSSVEMKITYKVCDKVNNCV